MACARVIGCCSAGGRVRPAGSDRLVGAPDPGRGTIVQAFVVLRQGATPDADKAAELQDYAKQSIAPYKYPRSVEFVAELPKTVSGKTQRYRLRQLAEEKGRSRSA